MDQILGTILVVDDSKKNLKLMTSILEPEQYVVLQATGGTTALKIAENAKPDLILLDIRMPDMDGFEVCGKLKEDSRLKDIPVIFLSGLTEQEEKLKAFQAGGVDYIEKPIQAEEVIARVKTHIQLYRMKMSLEALVGERTRKLEEANRSLQAEIDQRKKTEARLTRSHERYQFLYHHTPVMLHSIDQENRLISVNDYWLKKMGYARDEVIGNHVTRFMTDISIRLTNEIIDPALKDYGFIENAEYQLKKKNGDVIDTLFSAALETDDQGERYTLAFIMDVTERKLAEKEKMQLERQLRQAQKMEAIGTLAGGITHDFNNVLTAIMGYSDLALEKITPDNPIHPFLKQVLQASHRAKALVKQILTFSRQAEQEKAPIHICPIIKETTKLIMASQPPDIVVSTHIRTDADMIFGDATQIYQVLMNLFTNAIHAMGDKGGQLSIILDAMEINDDVPVVNRELSKGPHLKLEVRDTGHGMSPDILERIFDPFFTTKGREEGTGMGLAVTHGIIRNHFGTITVSSTEHAGTCFVLYLPQISDAEEIEEHKNNPPLRGTERVLLVDDDPLLINIGKKMLESLGYEVTAMKESPEALERFRSQPDQFDIVITDQTMPRMKGVELALALMDIRPDIPVILCTGFSHLIDSEKAKALGIKEFLLKPYVQNDMSRAIRRILDGHE